MIVVSRSSVLRLYGGMVCGENSPLRSLEPARIFRVPNFERSVWCNYRSGITGIVSTGHTFHSLNRMQSTIVPALLADCLR